MDAAELAIVAINKLTNRPDVTATTTLSATRALHIKTPRDRQRTLQEMLM